MLQKERAFYVFDGVEAVSLIVIVRLASQSSFWAALSHPDPMHDVADVPRCIHMQEKPDAVLPTMGGQTALNLAKGLSEVRTPFMMPLRVLHVTCVCVIKLGTATGTRCRLVDTGHNTCSGFGDHPDWQLLKFQPRRDY